MDIVKGLRFQSKVFWNSKLLVFLEILAAIGIVTVIVVVGRLGSGSYWISSVMVRFSFYLLAFIAIIAYATFMKGLKRDIVETSAVITGGKYSQRWSAFISQAIIQYAFLFLLLAVIYFWSSMNDGNDYFMKRIFLNYSWNILLPGLVFLLAAWTCSNFFSVRRGFLLFVSFLILASPLIQEMVWTTKPFFPIDKVVSMIRWPFALLYQNSEWSANSQLDLQIEIPRQQLIFFWIIGLLGLNVIKSYFDSSARVMKTCLGAIVFLVSATLLILSYLPASTYHLSTQWDGSIYGDYLYYLDNEYQHEMGVNPDYRASEMEISVQLGRQLCVDGTIRLEADRPREEYVFTLYHGYRVKHLSDAQNPEMTWRQEEDYLYVTYPTRVSAGELHVEYEGYDPTYYSFSGGAMLPAYFPWYPMAGKKQIYIFYEGGYGYNSYNEMDMTNVILHLDMNRDLGVVTNLGQVSENTFAGNTTGISLFAGLIEPTGDDKVRSYMPTDFWKSDDPIEQYIDRNKQQLEESIAFFVNDVELPHMKEILDKPMFIVSSDISRNGGKNRLNIMGDHIICTNGAVEKGEVIRVLSMKYGGDFQLASQFYFGSGNDLGEICRGKISELKESIETCEEIIQNPDAYQSTVVERCEKTLPESVDLLEKIEAGVKQCGEEEFLKKVLQYALLDKEGKSDDDFERWIAAE